MGSGLPLALLGSAAIVKTGPVRPKPASVVSRFVLLREKLRTTHSTPEIATFRQSEILPRPRITHGVLLCERVRTVIHCLRQRSFPCLITSRCLFGNCKFMRLKSAREDFEANSLGAVPGLLGRLSYVGGLHYGKGTGTGRYNHWGLAKVYGDDAAQSAIRASHRVLLSEVLKEPLAVLLNDLAASCANEHLTEREFLALLTHSAPKPLSPSALAHLRSVLNALSALVESRNDASLRGASQPQQPAQESRPPAGI